MHEVPVSGIIKTIAAREGSSGIFTGSIEGLYQGYRFGSTSPDEREFVIEAPHGSIALLLRQQIVTPLPPRPAEHPFAGGKDPFKDPSALLRGGPPPGVPGGPPAGVPGGPPGGGPPADVHGEASHGPGAHPDVFKRVHYMEAKLHVIPEKSTGIFEGANGEFEIFAPNYKMPGYLVIDTERGKLRLDFLEAGSRNTLDADLWVNGEESTGIYKGARGELKFSLKVTPPFFGEGPYSGSIWLEDASAM